MPPESSQAGANVSHLTRVREIRLRMPPPGARQLHHLPSAEEEPMLHVGRDRLFALLRQSRMLAPARRAYQNITDNHHRFYKHPNRLKAGPGQAIAAEPENVWGADIIYLQTKSGMVYLCLVTDACSRKIVGYNVHESLQTADVVEALNTALKTRQRKTLCVHHSDRGVQYCSAIFQAVQNKHGLSCSMTEGYDCYQNALAERLNGILNTEFLLTRPARDEQARRMVDESALS